MRPVFEGVSKNSLADVFWRTHIGNCQENTHTVPVVLLWYHSGSTMRLLWSQTSSPATSSKWRGQSDVTFGVHRAATNWVGVALNVISSKPASWLVRERDSRPNTNQALPVTVLTSLNILVTVWDSSLDLLRCLALDSRPLLLQYDYNYFFF